MATLHLDLFKRNTDVN